MTDIVQQFHRGLSKQMLVNKVYDERKFTYKKITKVQALNIVEKELLDDYLKRYKKK